MSLVADLRMLARGLIGRTPPPLIERRRSVRASPAPNPDPNPSPNADPDPIPSPSRAQPVTIRLGARESRVLVPDGDTILDAARAAGIPLEFSCTVGGCGTCALMLTSGDVELDEPNSLTAAERASGLILPCVARPTSPCTIAAPP